MPPEFNDSSSLLAHLSTRRSVRPRDLAAPGPDADQLAAIVTLALRTPDHGKLAPWRVVAIAADQRDTLAEALVAAYRADKPDAGRLELEAMDNFARMAPALLLVLHSPKESSKIPAWEQELSTGAFTMNLLHAAHCHGFAAGWITGWPAYSDRVRALFGEAHEKIAGFVFIGTASAPLEERPRPNLEAVLSPWQRGL